MASPDFVHLDSTARGIHPDEAMNDTEGFYAVTHSSPGLYYALGHRRCQASSFIRNGKIQWRSFSMV